MHSLRYCWVLTLYTCVRAIEVNRFSVWRIELLHIYRISVVAVACQLLQILMNLSGPNSENLEIIYVCAILCLTPSTPAVPNCCCSKGSVPYWCNPPFLIFDTRALWRSVLSARAPECQKFKMVGYTSMAKCKALTGSAVKGLSLLHRQLDLSALKAISKSEA